MKKKKNQNINTFRKINSKMDVLNIFENNKI